MTMFSKTSRDLFIKYRFIPHSTPVIGLFEMSINGFNVIVDSHSSYPSIYIERRGKVWKGVIV